MTIFIIFRLIAFSYHIVGNALYLLCKNAVHIDHCPDAKNRLHASNIKHIHQLLYYWINRLLAKPSELRFHQHLQILKAFSNQMQKSGKNFSSQQLNQSKFFVVVWRKQYFEVFGIIERSTVFGCNLKMSLPCVQFCFVFVIIIKMSFNVK